MRARVTSETVPPPFSTLLVVWELTPARAATSLTEACLVGLRDATVGLLCAGSERSPSDLVGGRMEPRSEYPRPRFQRPDWINLNGEWEFGAGERPTFDRRIVVPFCPESKLSGIGRLCGDTVWYRRRFDASAADYVRLHFGAVDYRATVWVNDVEVARHVGGHTPFSADITPVLRARDNVLVVRADDTLTDKSIPRGKQFWGERPEGIFYTPTTGIWQTVWLEPLPARHIRALRINPDLAAGAVEFELDADGRAGLDASLDGAVVGRWSGVAGPGRLGAGRG